MIENYDTEEFERTLKEHADRFFLIPSERVWKSIYNDIHPGSKWPSLAVGLFMLLTLFWIGNVNQPYTGGIEENHGENTIDHTPAKTAQQEPHATIPFIQKLVTQNTDHPSVLTESNVVSQHILPEKVRQSSGPVMDEHYQTIAPGITAENPKKITDLFVTPAGDQKEVTPPGIQDSELKKITPVNTAKINVTEKARASDLKTSPSSENTPGLRLNSQFRKKLKWEFSFTPIISDVSFLGANLNKVNSTVVNTPVSKHDMNIAKRLGFMTGANAYYPLSNKISLTSGIHLVYTGYDIYSEVVQPNTTSLTLKDSKGKMFSKYYVSYYANDKRNNNTSITNFNWQLSVPVGVQWKVVSAGKMKISLLSTVEPFMVLGNKAYLLSGDASSYVTDPDLVRKFNLSGNIGGFIHLSSDRANWRIGPNFRYQILSTYNDVYPVKEHFINYGIQVGISKK